MTRSVPLRRSLALRFAIAALVPLLGVGALVLRHLAVEAVGAIGERNLLVARAVRGQVEGLLREPVVALQGLREMLSAADAASPQRVEALLDAAVRGAPLLESISLLDGDGRVAAVGLPAAARASRRDLLGIGLGHQPFVREAAAGKTAWSETHLSLVGGRNVVSVAVPVAGGGVLLGSVDVGRLVASAQRLHGAGSVTVSVIDRGGSIVAHPDPELTLRRVKVNHLEPVRRGFAGEEVTGRCDFLGRDALASVTRLPEIGWLVLVAQDAASAYHQPLSASLAILAGLLVASAVALLFAVSQARRIAGPLAGLAESARKVAAGGYEIPPSGSGTLEVRELAESFRAMAAAVRDREQRLRESEETYRLLVENAGDVIFIAQEGRLPFVNRRGERLAGLDARTLRQVPWAQLVHPEDRERLLGYDRALLAGEPIPDTISFRLVPRGGGQRWAQMSSVLFSWEGRPATLNFLRDITELKTLESQALQAQKMEAVGTLAGGVAHDFNNLLQAIQSSAELALLPGRDAAVNRRVLEQIVRAAERGAALTRQLLTFSRKVESLRRPLQLNEEVRQVARILERTLPKMVRIELDLAEPLPAVCADGGQVQQLLMNLSVNAAQAMAGEGLLRMVTRGLAVAQPDEARPEVLPGRYVSLSVSDTGSGIEERHHGRIFEPFFTTKAPGEGTGLGLAMVFGIVKAHEGHVWFECPPGGGTTFRILLPELRDREACVAPGAVAAAGPAAAEGVPGPGGGACILIVDDEESIRTVGAELLTAHGFRVLCAADGEAALRTWRERGGEIDLVLLDQIMPGMGGRRCLAELLSLDPGAAVLVMSGYAGREGEEQRVPAGARGFVGKPFRLQALLEEIRAALAARPRRETEPGRG